MPGSTCSESDLNSGIPITIEFGGGAEILFNNVRKHDVILPKSETPWTMKTLLVWIKENLLTGEENLFLQGDSVRPGIIVAINDTDWELLDDINYEIKPNDNIIFISSLHGG